MVVYSKQSETNGFVGMLQKCIRNSTKKALAIYKLYLHFFYWVLLLYSTLIDIFQYKVLRKMVTTSWHVRDIEHQLDLGTLRTGWYLSNDLQTSINTSFSHQRRCISIAKQTASYLLIKEDSISLI